MSWFLLWSHHLIFPRLSVCIHRMKRRRLCRQCAQCLLKLLLAEIETIDLLLWRNEEKEVGEVQPVRFSDNSSCFRSQIPCQIEGRDPTSGCILEHCLHPQGEELNSGALSCSEGATINGGNPHLNCVQGLLSLLVLSILEENGVGSCFSSVNPLPPEPSRFFLDSSLSGDNPTYMHNYCSASSRTCICAQKSPWISILNSFNFSVGLNYFIINYWKIFLIALVQNHILILQWI